MTITTQKDALEPGWSFLRSPRWIGYYALIIIFSIACVFLGNWQFDRRADAQQEIARIDNNYDAEAISLDAALPYRESFDVDTNKWQPIVIDGEYLDKVYLVRNRVSALGVGANLIQPIQTTNGNIFFVDRGWIDVNVSEGIPADLPKAAQGKVEVTVRLKQAEARIESRQTLGNTVGSIDLLELERLVALPSYTGAYGVLVSEIPAAQTGLLPERPERDEGPHLSYALQWYVFILIVIGGAWYAASLEWKSLNSKTASDKAQNKQKNQRRPRKLSDAEEEDAYLDAEP